MLKHGCNQMTEINVEKPKNIWADSHYVHVLFDKELATNLWMAWGDNPEYMLREVHCRQSDSLQPEVKQRPRTLVLVCKFK